MDTATLRAAARRFPLVGRARPTCRSLPERIHEITELTERAQRRGPDGMADAADALNRAALLASDCGLPEYAHRLCWQHIDVYRAADRPLSAHQARHMLEPVLNLARLQIRADDGEHALRLLTATHQAVMNGTDLIIDGQPLPVADLTGTRQEQHKLREWVWLQYLAEGVRALALAGRWNEAADHATKHRGVGTHLMDGRQAVIIAHCLNGETASARKILRDSTPKYPWEQQVAACLNVMCTHPGSAPTSPDVTTMINIFLDHEAIPGYTVFRTRLGLTIATLTAPAADRILTRLATEVITSGDGYAARDLLDHHPFTDDQHTALARLVDAAGLQSRELPEPLCRSLKSATEHATALLTASIQPRSKVIR